MAIGMIPWAIWGQWDIFVITSAGTLVAFTTNSLPRWREEVEVSAEYQEDLHPITWEWLPARLGDSWAGSRV